MNWPSAAICLITARTSLDEYDYISPQWCKSTCSHCYSLLLQVVLPQVLPLGRVAVGLPLHLLLPLIVANADVTSTDASSVLGATLNMILTRPQAPLTADSATGPAHGSRFCGRKGSNRARP